MSTEPQPDIQPVTFTPRLPESREAIEERQRVLADYKRDLESDASLDQMLDEAEQRRQGYENAVKVVEESNEIITESNERKSAIRKRLLIIGTCSLMIAGILKVLSMTLMAGW